MEHKKYRDFFLYKLYANTFDFDNEYKRVIEEFGLSDKMEEDFYKAAFKSVINNLKNEIPLDYDRILDGYRNFIQLLREDEIDVTDLVYEESEFSSGELKASIPIKHTTAYKSYNPNTKYGRRKAREQAQRNYENGNDEYRNEIDNITIVLWSIIIVITILFFIIKAKLS